MKIVTLFFLLLYALIPTAANSQSSQNAYDKDVIATDGPIIYGTGLSAKDRAAAWKHFFLMMSEACDRQEGEDVLGLKLAKRCNAQDGYCTIAIDAKLFGVGGIQEPRKVLTLVLFDIHDQNTQVSRTVCTWPEKDTRVCRDWDTGALMRPDQK